MVLKIGYYIVLHVDEMFASVYYNYDRVNDEIVDLLHAQEMYMY